MRVAYIFNHNFFLGGGEISFAELIRAIDKNLVCPIIFVSGKGEIEEKFANENMKVAITPFPPLGQLTSGAPLKPVWKLIKALKENRVDLIHVNGSRACFYAGLAGRILRIPVIWHVRETLEDIFFYDALLASLAKVIVCVSQSVKEKRFQRFGKRINKKIIVLHNAIDTVKFQMNEDYRNKTRKKLEISNGEILLGLVANIIPHKGQDFFLKAYAKAKTMRPEIPTKALLIGRPLDNSYLRQITQFIQDEGLSREIHVKDYTDNISEVLSALDIFVLPSQREGFSRSILEAMSCGLPVLATKLSEIEEAVVQGENGFLVSYNDVDKMAMAIIELSTNPTLRKKMGEQARRRVVEKFDLSSHARSFERIYAGLS